MRISREFRSFAPSAPELTPTGQTGKQPTPARQAVKDAAPRLLTRTEVAEIFHVSPATVTRWGESGKLPAVKTLGGHRRYDARVVMALADQLNRGEALMDKTLFTVPTMYADHHVIAVRQAIATLPGVLDAYASSAWQQVAVTFDPTKISAEDIARELTQAGYPPQTPDDAPQRPPVAVRRLKDPAWDALGVRVTTTNTADLEMSGEFRRY
jgi:excisionase family DNA binding protein